MRIVTWVELQALGSDKSFFVFNTHFDHVGNTAQQQSGLLVEAKIDDIAVVERFETVDDYGVPFISDHYPIMATIDCPDCS